MKAVEKLAYQNSKNRFICVGLDPDLQKIPNHLLNSADPIFEFNKAIIEETIEYAAAYKLNFAFYENEGIKGFETLLKTIQLIPSDVLIIGDAKRGDIGNTSKMYAHSVFDYFNCDAVTLHPYMGYDSINPFLEYSDKLNFVLALTSNKGAEDFEKLKLEDGSFLYQKIIKSVREWNKQNNCGIVFGATKLEDLKENINSFGDLPVLLPGVGAQGGSLVDVVKCFINAGRKNLLINSSRGIIYKDNSAKFAEAAREEIISLNLTINGLLQ
jgi:orotidine-5'-phosphate decarboxylase